MSEVLHANIFFAIASVATVLFIVLVSVALYQVIKILLAIRVIVDRLAAGSDVIAEDVATMRAFVKGGGLVSFIVNRFTPKRRSTRKDSKDTNSDDLI